MVKNIPIYILSLAIFSTINAQDVKTNSWFINFGIALPSTKETHYSSNFRKGIGCNVELGFERNTSKSIHQISLLFLQAPQGKGNISYSNLLKPQIRYEHLRKISDSGLNIGGYFDVGTLLNFRRGSWANENKINYTIWSSLGIGIQYNKPLQVKKRQLKWNTKFSVPFLTYLIRPSYTFPYSDNYLQNGVFSFDRSGLGEKIVTGGQLVTLNKFLNLGFQTGVTLPTENRNWEFGLNYSFNYLQTNEIKPVFQSTHLLNFIAKYLK